MKNMRKNILQKCISVLLTAVILSLGITGCAPSTKLNIIDDNYRNYYEVFVYSFYDSNGDGIGDIRGVDEKLPYIKDMGFNGIWLMPVMESTTYHKYDVVDYKNIDSEYGTIDDMKKLITDAHENDIRVIIDFAINHSSSKNDWFMQACDYLKSLPKDSNKSMEEMIEECPYVGYYHFTKEQPSSAYYKVAGTPYYYEGVFWSEMPDLNFDSEALRKEIENIASFWVGDMGVDGFRMDAVTHFDENNTSYNTEVLNWLYTYCKNINPNFYMVSEAWTSESTIAEYYGSRTDSFFNFDAASAEGKIIKCASGKGNISSFVKAMKGYEEEFGAHNENYIDAPFITNHDMTRVTNALVQNEDAIKFAGGLLMSMSGSPFVYYGEEIGLQSKGSKDESKRLPMKWDNDSYSEGINGTCLGPINADKDVKQTFDGVKEQKDNPDSILNYYKKALLIRNQNPEIARGTVTIFEDVTEGKHAVISKTYEDSSIIIIYNNSVDEEYVADLNKLGAADKKIVGYLTVDNSEVVIQNGTITVPRQSIVYVK